MAQRVQPGAGRLEHSQEPYYEVGTSAHTPNAPQEGAGNEVGLPHGHEARVYVLWANHCSRWSTRQRSSIFLEASRSRRHAGVLVEGTGRWGWHWLVCALDQTHARSRSI